MDLGRSYIPPELLVEIAQRLPVADLKHLRSVCKGLAAVASRFLFQTVYISTQLRDRQNLTSISSHVIFSACVKEIIYDSTYLSAFDPLEGYNFKKANYRRFFRKGAVTSGRIYTKAAIDRGFNLFQACLRDQADHFEFNGTNLTRYRDFGSLPADFSSLLENPGSHAAAALYLPDDLVRLIEALPKLPNIRRFRVSDCRHILNNKHYGSALQGAGYEGFREFSFSVQDEGVRGLDAVILDPRPWPDFTEDEDPGNNRSWYRGFSVLMQAASMANLERLGSFKVDSNSDYSGLSHSILDMSSSELRHATNAFRNLRTINLKIDSNPVHDCRPGKRGDHSWSQTLESGSIAVALSAATHLETLELEFNEVVFGESTEVPSLAKLIGTGTRPHLRSVRLSHMVLFEDQYLKFFREHCKTLESLCLEQVALFTDDWATQRKGYKTYRSWRHAFKAMGANELALTNFEMHFHIWDHPNFAVGDCIRHHAHGATEVLQTLQSGGKVELKKRCRHCYERH